MQTNILCVLVGHEFNPPDARECRRPNCEFVKADMSEGGYVNVDSLATKEIERPTTELCGKVLVGQGDDTSDPMCMLPRGHAEPCSSAPMGDPLADVSEDVMEAVTSAILQQNMRPGPKLTHFMARVRAKAAIIEWRNHEDKWIREWKDENLRLQNEVLNYKIQVAGLLEKIQHDSAYKKVDGTCPACGSKGTLFLGEGGYVTCSWESCKDPCAADKLLHNDRASESMRERLSAIHSLSSPKAPNR